MSSHVPYAAYLCIDGGRRTAFEGRTDIIEESITALGHLYGEIKGAQTAVRLNDGHYVNKKTTERAADQRSLEVNLLNQVAADQPPPPTPHRPQPCDIKFLSKIVKMYKALRRQAVS